MKKVSIPYWALALLFFAAVFTTFFVLQHFGALDHTATLFSK